MSTLIYDIPNYEPESQIQFGFQIILKAFEKRSGQIDNEIAKIRELIKSKDNKIEEYENNLECILKDNKTLQTENENLKNEKEYLIDRIKKLNEDNKQPLKLKNIVIASLDHDSNFNKLQLLEFLESRNKNKEENEKMSAIKPS